MTLFQHLCRETGSVLHLLLKPISASAETTQKLHQKTTTTQQQMSETMIIRRTIIEEVEVRKTPISQ